MKKTLMTLVGALLVALTAGAQAGNANSTPFRQGKVYLGASATGFDMGSQEKDFHLGFDAKGGYFFADNFLAMAQVSYDYRDNTDDWLAVGVGARYYMDQNGIYLGAGAKLKNITNDTDFMPCVQVGYAFFLNRTVTIEPELYFDFSTNDFDKSCYGLRITVAVNLE